VGARLGQAVDGRWFKRSISSYQTTFEQSIVPALIKHGVPVAWATEKGLSEAMPAWFQGAEEGEQLRTCAIFGRKTAETAVQKHYVALERPALDAYYVKVLRDLWRRMSDNAYVSNGRLFHQVPTADVPPSTTGNDWAPEVAKIRAVILALKAQLEMSGDLPRFERHNLVAAYVGAVLSIVTAFRDVKTPIVDLSLIDPDTGFINMQEKCREDGAHARLVWIPPAVQTLVDDYLAYLRGLRAALPQGVPGRMTVPATKFRDRRRADDGQFQLDLERTLFFFEPDGSEWAPVEFTGTRLKRYLDDLIPEAWPIGNAGRHFAGTQFFKAGTGYANLTKAHMGHWHLGESPWAPDSGFDPYALREALGPVLCGLLDEIGFERIAL
jgi:hypothetical protein